MKRLLSTPFAVVLLALVALLAYANTFQAPFLFDDLSILLRNPHIRTLLPIGLSPRWLVNLSFKLNYQWHGYHVSGYHVANLLIHVAAGLLLYGILRRTLTRKPLRAAYGAVAAPLALVVAALWTLHPLQTESVTYICQRYESMMGLCLLATLYSFIRSVDAAAPRARRLWGNAALVCCALGMGTKEVMVVTPFLVWGYDVCFVGGSWTAPWRERRWLHTALFLTLGVLVMFELFMLGHALAAESGLTGGLSPARYLASQTGVILHYLRLSVLPRGLCLDYAWPAAAGWGAVWWQTLVIAALGLVSLWGLLRRHPAGFLGAAFFLLLAPTSSVLPVPDIAFEHRMYLPLACVLTGLVLWAYRLLVGRLRPPLLVGLAVALALTLAGLTFARNADYRSELAMWRDVAVKRPDNLRARIELAIALAESGQADEAARHFEAVLARIPPAARARFVRGEVDPGGFATMSSRFHYFRAHANYGRLLAGHPATRAAAINHYILALRAAPHHPVAETYLRDALREEGVAEPELEAEILRRITTYRPR
ncbi:MAG: hypothetical protein HN919_18670 [Verrucomicrobia bacterium]|jgi:protein O-mannosyl-transferase|nr:hypothetical protein [Verrucomicrobiota bacterium]MBT7068328.1 hypothetical protein [Verrucomicrobiota bacterium]MBT7699858.1 hypothetical protein [Verrucomicrobiota bacterium]